MAIAHAFQYVKPRTLREAMALLSRRGPRTRLLAGGTDLITLMADGAVLPDWVMDIKGIRELKGLELRGNKVWIGARATFTDVLENEALRKRFPLFSEMAQWVASNGVRNRATLIGNICSAVPCCDTGPVLLIYEADVFVQGPRGKRKIPIEAWFTGPRKTALKPGEIALGAEVAAPREKHAGCFVKLRRYKGEDLAQASVTVMALAGRRFRVAFGSVAPTPVRGRKIEALLEGKDLSDDLIQDAVALLPQEISPITDIRASREYRMHMVGVMLERGLRAAASRLAGGGPALGVELI
jgi:CO/xanthine dehydrogenase FAD-binding subunit